MIEIKVGKLYLQFISKLFQGGKNMVVFLLKYMKTDCFVLEVSTVGRFQTIITSAGQEKENKVLYITMKK